LRARTGALITDGQKAAVARRPCADHCRTSVERVPVGCTATGWVRCITFTVGSITRPKMPIGVGFAEHFQQPQTAGTGDIVLALRYMF